MLVWKKIYARVFLVQGESDLFDESDAYLPYHVIYNDGRFTIGRVIRDDFALSKTKLLKMIELFDNASNLELLIGDVEMDDLLYFSSCSFRKATKESIEAIRKILIEDYTKQLSEAKVACLEA